MARAPAWTDRVAAQHVYIPIARGRGHPTGKTTRGGGFLTEAEGFSGRLPVVRLIYTLLLVAFTAVWGWTFVVVQDALYQPDV